MFDGSGYPHWGQPRVNFCSEAAGTLSWAQEEAKEAFRELMARHRNLRFVSVDAATLETSIEKKVGIKPLEGAHQLLHFTRYNVSDKPKVVTRAKAAVLIRRTAIFRDSAILRRIIDVVERKARKPRRLWTRNWSSCPGCFVYPRDVVNFV